MNWALNLDYRQDEMEHLLRAPAGVAWAVLLTGYAASAPQMAANPMQPTRDTSVASRAVAR